MRGRVRRPSLLERGEVVEREHVLQRARARTVELGALLGVLARARPMDCECSRTYSTSFGELFGVDGHDDRADVGEREVEQRPLERRPREDRERVALADAAREQPVGESLDALGGLGPGHVVPVVVVLDEVRGIGVPACAIASRQRRGIVRSAGIARESTST